MKKKNIHFNHTQYISFLAFIWPFDFVTQSSFSLIVTHRVVLHYFIGPLEDNSRHLIGALCMGKPFKVSTQHFVFSFCKRQPFVSLCFKLSLATSTGVDSCFRLSFAII